MTNIANTTSNGNDLVPGTNVTWAEAGAMHKDYLRDQRIERVLRGSGKRRSNGSGRGFYVLAADGSIDKRATRERRLFGPNAAPVVADDADEIRSNWDGTYSLNGDGSIDKRATRERRIFGEPVDDRFDFDCVGLDEIDSDGGDSFYVFAADGSIDKEATRERRLFGSSRWN